MKKLKKEAQAKKGSGLDLSIFSEAFAKFGMDAVTYAIIRPSYFITALVAVIVATLLMFNR